MREIKFRAWDEKLKRMCKVYAIDFKNERIVVYHKSEDQPSNWLKLDRFILMRYAELKDKNGKGIYEGDIVKGLKDGQMDCEKFGTVIFVNGCFRDDYYKIPLIRHREKDIFNIEVIGNKYDDPELLEKK